MLQAYRTIQREASDVFVERRSRFIGHIRPVQTESEALAFVAEKKKEYWDATHNVYAYVLRDGGIRRYSDDGEPQGTAGIPVLEVLLKEGLTDCVVVVTRYFGGILLGGGGLIRAYSHGARLAVDAGIRLDMRPCDRAEIHCDYAQYGWAHPLLLSSGGVLEDTVYTEEVTLIFHIPQERTAVLEGALTEQSAGRLVLQRLDSVYCPFSVEVERSDGDTIKK